TCYPYAETVESKGDGRDKYWEDFPTEQWGSAEKAAPPVEQPVDQGFGGGEFGFGGGSGNADAKLHYRVAGQTIDVAIAIDIDEGWHLYHRELGPPDAIGYPTKITLSARGVSWGEVVFPEPHKSEQSVGLEGDPTWIWTHSGEITLFARGSFDGDAPTSVRAVIEGLTCEDQGSCVPWNSDVSSRAPGDGPVFASFPSNLAVTTGSPAAPAEPTTAPTATSESSGAVDYA
ncbi:MAG: hypothetical protein GY825_13860, partial [Phycisphaeraceae bacterium]|nr:hypothetical protein [Phycisphaeraceae bacterium]